MYYIISLRENIYISYQNLQIRELVSLHLVVLALRMNKINDELAQAKGHPKTTFNLLTIERSMMIQYLTATAFC